MKSSELLRVRFAFGALGAVPVFLAGWLGWLQVVQGGTLPRRNGTQLPLVAKTADNQAWIERSVPAPRGTVVDRAGRTLAADCEVYEVRAVLRTTFAMRKDVTKFHQWLDRSIDGLALALVADPEIADRGEEHLRHRERLRKLLHRKFRVDDLPESGKFPDKHPQVADVLVSGNVDRLAVVSALRHLDARKDYPRLELDFLSSYRRVYPDRDLTYGIVGHITTAKQELPNGSWRPVTYGVCGLESLRALEPDAGAKRSLKRDGRGKPYFVAPVEAPPEGNVLHSTIDIELQRAAMRELKTQAEKGARGSGKQPEWGALVLVEIATGDVLAAASWHKGDRHPKATRFTPYQNLFEPGSIVKPLVLAYANEVGALDWSQQFDCKQFSPTYKERIQRLGRRRPVTDDHDCHMLDAHGILVNSSNIGAAYVGLMLEREQWRDYMSSYGFGKTLGFRLPHESLGGTHKRSFDPSIPLRGFRANSAISFSFGYEMQTTAMQVARAYLRMFRGMTAELRLVKALEVGGEFHTIAPPADTGPYLRPEVVERVRSAMTDVVSNDQHATGFHMHRRMLDELGVDLHGVVAGKTGTAASRVGIGNNRMKNVRNASFVGFVPAEQPRWLAVCVLQKDGSARFYGGSYAAPPAVRLLLQCQQLAEHGRSHQEPRSDSGGQTRVGLATPGSSGWRESAGADHVRDTR